ncbi:unnamed protein product [Paramecium sonneborni]|uniref:Uncharacterized protein n=1 Tax=Paramecium sonneborni TaxID=65129 RepID=A0A8S1RQN9_9CILI|nr:unnamed protein product [Paramecium sonneborni]
MIYNYVYKKAKSRRKLFQPLSLTQSATPKNLIDNKFPKQESPIKMGLACAIYSPSQKQYHPLDDIQIKNNYQSAQRQSQRFIIKKRIIQQKSITDVRYEKEYGSNRKSQTCRNYRNFNHLQDVEQAEATQLSSSYLQEIIALQQNVGKVLKKTSKKVYK